MDFINDGIERTRLYSISDILKLRKFVHSWISDNFIAQGIAVPLPKNLSQYHLWAEKNKIPHESLFTAPFRFKTPGPEIKSILINSKLRNIFTRHLLNNPELIDEGMGWLGYRIIRPGMNDGYPMSCKNWGASKGAYSVWLPLFTFGSEYSLKFVKGSRNRAYRNYLPVDGKFTKDELRLDPSEDVKVSSLRLLPGQALFYHPKTLHSENNSHGNLTRINLEFRFLVEDSQGNE